MKSVEKNIEKESRLIWNFFMSMIYLALVSVILAFGYVALGDDIQALLNQKTITAEDIRNYKPQSNEGGEEVDYNKVVDGIHVYTGLKADPNLQVIIGSCTSCHSAKLITQNKATRAGWKSMILWMQATQGLQDLGNREPIILDYLAKYYAPENMGRRKNIDIAAIEWFILDQKEENK